MIHAYGLDTGLTHNAAYWETLYTSRALELQNRFDDGRMYTNREENRYFLAEEQTSHENALAIWAKWAVRQSGFNICKDAP